jgi:hypothetical protein
MIAIALVAGSMTFGVLVSRVTLGVLFRFAEYTRSYLAR